MKKEKLKFLQKILRIILRRGWKDSNYVRTFTMRLIQMEKVITFVPTTHTIIIDKWNDNNETKTIIVTISEYILSVYPSIIK